MLDHPGPFSEAHGGPIMAQNSTKSDASWPKMTLKFPVWPQMALKHFPWEYYMILCHVGPPWGLFRGTVGPKMAQNSTKMAFMAQSGPVGPKIMLKWRAFMTQNVPSWPKMYLHDPNGPKTFLRGIINDYITYWTTLGPFQRLKWPQCTFLKIPLWPDFEIFFGERGGHCGIRTAFGSSSTFFLLV